jgi:tetratricopeptide (TPR) repeat protein
MLLAMTGQVANDIGTFSPRDSDIAAPAWFVGRETKHCSYRNGTRLIASPSPSSRRSQVKADEGELNSKFKINNLKLKFLPPAIGKYRLIPSNTAPSPSGGILSLVGVRTLACPARPGANRSRQLAVSPMRLIRPIPSPQSPPHPDSCHPKSTVDLGRQALIWGDNALFSHPHAESACPKPIDTLGIFSISRNQTEIKPNQTKKLFSTLDLGCLPSFSPSFLPPGVGKCRLVSPNVGPSPPGYFSCDRKRTQNPAKNCGLLGPIGSYSDLFRPFRPPGGEGISFCIAAKPFPKSIRENSRNSCPYFTLRHVPFAKFPPVYYFLKMKFFAACALALFLALPLARAQENPDDQYVIIYTLIQQGDSYVDAGQPQKALGNYQEAQSELQKFQQAYGDWNPNIVSFRLNYLSSRIAALTTQSVPTNTVAADTNATPAPVVITTSMPTPPSAPNPGDLQSQVNSLSAQIHQLQSDNETLQNKLKEALSVQPASVSPDAFAQMQAQVSELARQNDLLKAQVAQGTNAAMELALAKQTARANQLARQNQDLQSRVQSLTVDASAVEALREENSVLKQEIALGAAAGMTNAAPNTVTAPGNNNDELAQARAQIARLQSDATANFLENAALENRIKQLQEASVETAAAPTETTNEADLQSRLSELTLERDNLLLQLGEANKKLYGSKNQSAAAQIDTLVQQVETLRDRVAMDEAQPVPYSQQELAMFMPQPVRANPNAEKKSISQLPNGAAMLVAEAQSFYTNGQYAKAEADYQQILNRDPNNPLALANLASIEVEENKMDSADKHISAAVAQDPSDAFNLTVLGRVKFSEGKYDDSLDALSRAAKLDPQNPDIQNFLGVAYAQKGLRSQAETAFRKAIEIDSNYGDAHKNLAIIYLSANPPLVELARWHYEKALAAGIPPNLDLERMLNQAGPGSQQ